MNDKSNQFLSILQTEIHHIEHLYDLLIAEKSAIETNQIADLDEISQNKQQALINIEDASRHRAEFLLAAVQAPSDKERLRKFIDNAPKMDKELLEKRFSLLDDALSKCKEQNNINAMIISMNQRHIERNMNILKGIDNNSMTYTNKGTTQAAQEKLSGVKA
ncbi:MAG: flagellar protein FlgN [Gammaproteobacteria bacterium]|nr:flagellar protein FlgN [Gammaproteobacteria bacterium]NNJ72100.1 flagellar protein FlgN [Enterobacterales bacterium]